MTSFVCRTCGSSWNEGPTRDHVDDQNCRHCAASNQDNLIVQVGDLQGGLAVAQARIKALEMQAPGYAEMERERIIRLINESEAFYLADKFGVYAEAKIREAFQP